MSRKQQLYINILALVLPHARNIQTQGIVDRFFDPDLYPDLELVHNIPPLLETEELTVYDVYWLNTQAANYMTACRIKERHHSEEIGGYINELASMVTGDLRKDLTFER